MSASVEAGFLVLPVVSVLAGWVPAQQGVQGVAVSNGPAPVTAPYDVLTNDLTEFTNFHPEPFAGIALDVDGGILAVNPYNNTWIRYAGPSATSPQLRVLTGHNPVSIGVWNPGPTPADRRVVVVCTGSHAAFLHDPIDGRVLDVLRLDSEPADLEIDAESPRAFVSCRGSNTVVEIHLPTFTVADRYPIGCGQRPGPLYLDQGDPQSAGDERVYVAAMVTGNNSIFSGPMDPVGFVLDLDTASMGDLPDQDVFRIDPSKVGELAVDPVVRRAGSLIFELSRHPGSDELWILSTDSHNKGPFASEPEIAGKTVTNQLVRVHGVDAASGEIDAVSFVDLDDLTPGAPNPTYETARSVNQVRSLVFEPDGEAFVGGPLSDVIAHLAADGTRLGDLVLPRRAQCYALRLHGSGALLALCLGTMTIEVFPAGASVPGTPLALGNDPTPGQIRRGRDITLDGRISESGRSSCFACHEGGRSDQLGWLIPGLPTDVKDVMVTQSLLSIEDTFPHHWRGERDMADFRKAFEGLLGAPAVLAPTEPQMRDVIAFILSLKAPANPVQNPRRVLDNRIGSVAPDGFPAAAVNGQVLFRTGENFNGNTCAECHIQTTGSNANMLFEVGSFVPRAQELEVAHLRQLQHKGLDTVFLQNGPNLLEVNENGFGATHDGARASVFRFIFDTGPFKDAFSDPELRDIASYVDQFDQGCAPGAHWTTWYRQGSPTRVEKEIADILVQGSEQGWLDAVVFGRFHDGTSLREARWLYDPAQDAFVTDDPVLTSKTWPQFKAATQAGLAANAFLGVPWGNGFRVAFDPDFDDLASGDELALGTDPWKLDSDGDRWPDGYEIENVEDPLVAQQSAGDDALPGLVSAELDFVTARGAKWHARFSEDVTYVVEYALPGGPVHTYRREHFVRADTFVLTHASPSAPFPDELNKPEPDGALVFSATITLTDRAGKSSGPLPLAETFTPLAAQAQGGLVAPQPGVFPPLGSFVHVGGMTATVDAVGGGSLTATVTIESDYHYSDPSTSAAFDANERVLVCTLAVQDPATGDFVQSGLPSGPFAFTSTPAAVPDFPLWDFDGLGGTTETTFLALPTIPGPFVLCPPTVNGVTQFSFTQHGLTTPGQQVKIAVQAILIPVEIDDGAGGTKTVHWSRSLFHMQPLLTEDDAVDLSGPEFQGTAEVVIPF